jgi:hypothetical protein
MNLGRGRLGRQGTAGRLEPPPDRGCVRRTSRSKCGCPKSPNEPKTRGLAAPLRLVLRTQPRSVSARFWRWFQDAPGTADVSSAELLIDCSAGKMLAAPCGSWKAPWTLLPCIGALNPARVRSAGFPACGLTGHSCPVFHIRATGKSPEPADRNVCPTDPRFMESPYGVDAVRWDLEPA